MQKPCWWSKELGTDLEIDAIKGWIRRLDEAEKHGENVTAERTIACDKAVAWAVDRLH